LALDVLTPRIVAVGEIDEWPHRVIERLPGRTLRSAWNDIAPHTGSSWPAGSERCRRSFSVAGATPIATPIGMYLIVITR
jgi:hypothetical protein